MRTNIYMKHTVVIILLVFLLRSDCFSTDSSSRGINIYGNTNYSVSKTSSLATAVHVEYTVLLYEPDHKKWGVFLAGKVNPLYDHLGQELKMDVFTVIGIDF